MLNIKDKFMRKLLLTLIASSFVSAMAADAPSSSPVAEGAQKECKFKLSGVSVADVGGASITAEGEVYNLSKPSDLSGSYSAVTAGATVGAGGSVAYLKNENGVVIKLHSQTEGLRFNLSANGMHITMQ
jgi:hypothetical protein